MVKEHIKKLPQREEDTHKGDYGKVLVVAGSRGMTGAAYLTSQGALKSGSGLVTCAIPESLNEIMEVKLTEVMTLALPDKGTNSLGIESKKAILDFASKCDVVALGPGLGQKDETQSLVKELIEKIEKPLVIDADGINALGGQLDILRNRKGRTVLTPHPGEMARLLGKDIDSIRKDKEEVAKSVAEITSAVVCLKGHRTVVASPEGQIYVNETGNSGMATGGMGDVLTGMIASFIGQGVEDYSASIISVYLHGLAGDIAAEKEGVFSMTATDVLSNLHLAFERAGI